jgi:hypothetical protein
MPLCPPQTPHAARIETLRRINDDRTGLQQETDKCRRFVKYIDVSH